MTDIQTSSTMAGAKTSGAHRPGRTLAIIAATVLVVGFTVDSAASATGLVAGHEVRDQRSTYPAPAALTVAVTSSDVEVTRTAGNEVVVDRHRMATVKLPTAHDYLAGNTLHLNSQCHWYAGWGLCSTRYRVAIPDSVALTVTSESGDVRVSSLDRAATITAQSGDIHVRDVTAPTLSLRAESGDIHADNVDVDHCDSTTRSGSIHLADVTTDDLQASTESGDQHLQLASAPSTVRATAESGDLHIEVPDDSTGYDVSPITGSGDPHIEVTTAVDSGRHMDLKTESGDIHVNYAG